MSILVIGCGAMGSFIARLLKRRGLEVILHDRDRRTLVATSKRIGAPAIASLDRDLTDVEGVIIAVPVDNAPRVIKDVSRRLREGAWLMEIASFKTPLQQALSHARMIGLTCISAHPLFGPMVDELAGTKTAHVSPVEREEERRILKRILKGTRIVEVSTELHDEAMGVCISLTHAIGLAAGLLLTEMGGTTLTLSTKSLSVLNKLAAISLTEPPSFYMGYTMNNKYAEKAYSTFVEKLMTITSKKNRNKLHLIAGRTRREMDRLIEIKRLYREVYESGRPKKRRG